MDRDGRSWTRGSGVACGVALAAVACFDRGPQASSSSSEPPNVVLVTIDTLRADHLGCYGYPRNTSPFIDQLAASGVLFENGFTSSSATSPALASLFTGLEVDQHGVFNNFFDHFPDHYSSLYTMAQMFSDRGYRSVGIAAVPFLEYLADGFSEFQIGPLPVGSRPGRAPDDPAAKYHYAPAERQFQALVDVVSTMATDDRFFVWLHLYDVHEYDLHHRVQDPNAAYEREFDITSDAGRHELVDALYRSSGKVLSRQPQLETANVYDEKIRFVDRSLQRIHEFFERSRLDENLL